ncbi:PilZ domain-containing protein [Desulfopila sp. IMCC35006]|uniref:PilZ domain-containing protein n=1 Tax=Desulfopila sp. IMCC35006 TaxID=2569542 RepID=UPI0010AB580B|nr:PilZ domain-containing protein [Desulfopila sp. IMCC35006]TKB24290.1 PilZ domain-containing protein [Desulfopila sp. IMCC35006]
MSIERREQKRFSLNLQAKISYRHIDDPAPVIDTVAANISSGGAFIQTAHKFPMAAKVKIEFYLSLADLKRLRFILSVESLRQLTDQNVWVIANGIVIRQEKDGVGIIFDTDYQLTPMQGRAT